MPPPVPTSVREAWRTTMEDLEPKVCVSSTAGGQENSEHDTCSVML